MVPDEGEPLTGYKKYSLVFIGYSIAGTLLAIVLHYYDVHNKRMLISKNPNKRQRILNMEES